MYVPYRMSVHEAKEEIGQPYCGYGWMTTAHRSHPNYAKIEKKLWSKSPKVAIES
jgi:hypothetical protein